METEQDQFNTIKELFLQMGASEVQAKVMASQLLKRSQQIAADQNITIIEAVESLLKKVIEARQRP